MQRAIDKAEADVLGLPQPEPKLRFCTMLSDNVRQLAGRFDSTALRALGVDLGCYRKVGILRGRPHLLVATDISERLKLVTLDNAPNTVEGLMRLGEHRVRYLAYLLVVSSYNKHHFLLKRGKKDLELEELVSRVLRGLRDHDKQTHGCWERRDAMPDKELFEPPAEPPPFDIGKKAIRLFTKSMKSRMRPRRISRNASNAPGRRKRRHQRAYQVEARLRCGCIIMRTIENEKGFFYVNSAVKRCLHHPAPPKYLHRAPPGAPIPLSPHEQYGVMHVDELWKDPRPRRSSRDHHILRRRPQQPSAWRT